MQWQNTPFPTTGIAFKVQLGSNLHHVFKTKFMNVVHILWRRSTVAIKIARCREWYSILTPAVHGYFVTNIQFRPYVEPEIAKRKKTKGCNGSQTQGLRLKLPVLCGWALEVYLSLRPYVGFTCGLNWPDLIHQSSDILWFAHNPPSSTIPDS